MTQTNELSEEKLGEIIKKYVNHFTIAHDPNYFEKIKSIKNEIMSLIPQPEQLEVELTVGNLSDDWMKDVEAKIRFLQYFDTKQEALDFCKRYNLKIVNEEKE